MAQEIIEEAEKLIEEAYQKMFENSNVEEEAECNNNVQEEILAEKETTNKADGSIKQNLDNPEEKIQKEGNEHNNRMKASDTQSPEAKEITQISSKSTSRPKFNWTAINWEEDKDEVIVEAPVQQFCKETPRNSTGNEYFSITSLLNDLNP